ncbi:kinase-like domain-containing protein [Pisolithus albus]|nr:kinase-like domain-containing protein [Pisolithus albus]
MSNFLELYEPLDIIGNGSFRIIRKVRRKTDGMIFARKELNFERMSERDRKQIVAEDLDHENIVRYHDRHVDREGGILYILMEYCGGGDLSSIIKQAQKHNRLVPEDTVWHYFMQILLALQHCHHPPNQGKDDRRPQILRRDLKPDNVFLDDSNNVKLGYPRHSHRRALQIPMSGKKLTTPNRIFGLSDASSTNFARSDLLHEAKTHSELSIFVRNGRIPPLPRGYSQALSNVIKAMLNLNPAMRPSATQLLQHERLVLISKVVEAEKMLATVKNHESAVVAKERDLYAREATLAEREAKLTTLVAEKDAEILRLHQLISAAESQVDIRIREAIGKREEELRLAVMKREQEVAAAMARQEEEIMDAVRQREREIFEAWSAREEQIRSEVNSAVQENMKRIAAREAELEAEQMRLDAVQKDLEVKLTALSNQEGKGRKERTPIDEVKHLLAPLVQITEEHNRTREKRQSQDWTNVETPISRNSARPSECMPSAMKGVDLTQTGQPLATPTPTELANLFVNSPKVGLDFAKIFDFESETEEDGEPEGETLPPSPSKRERRSSESSHGSSSTTREPSPASTAAPPTRLRKPSIRTSYRPPLRKTSTLPTSSSDRTGFNSQSAGAAVVGVAKSTSSIKTDHGVASSNPAPVTIAQAAEYDLSDEENLPRTARPKRPSTGNLLRAVAAANAASARPGSAGKGSIKLPSTAVGRTSTSTKLRRAQF